MNNQCGIILLAGGSSSRLGKPKQLLLYKQTTLLAYSIQAALESVANEVIVVLGAHTATINTEETKRLSVVVNDAWQEGMASSIRCGLQFLLFKTPDIRSALFMVCDQPFINAGLLNKLVTLQKETGRAIVASEYAGTTGIPAVFDKQLFAGLLQLKGDSGAKKLMLQQQDSIIKVPFPLGQVDIDTAADYALLQKM